MRPTLRLGKEDYSVGIVRREPLACLEINGRPLEIDRQEAAQEITVNGTSAWCVVAVDGDTCHIRLKGRTLQVSLLDPLDVAQGGARGDDAIIAPMPGAVVSVDCAPGDAVAEGATLLMIESMKLQMALTAPRDAIVAEIAVAPDETFEKGQLLLSFAKDEET